MRDKIDQIMLNQSTIMVALAALYADRCEDEEVLNQLQNRIKEMQETFALQKERKSHGK